MALGLVKRSNGDWGNSAAPRQVNIPKEVVPIAPMGVIFYMPVRGVW
jgi:hypothetical protein